MELLTNFYFLFESIYKYITELNKFIREVQDGHYIQMSLETMFFDKEGKQLLVRDLIIYRRSIGDGDSGCNFIITCKFIFSFEG